ncbi:flagellar hook-associated protein FlgL [Heliobacterium gestii]|uniref:Flagellar hook-associated protein FlgL n=1 Tax=Heliomicrobium gestii TaxID=2699 RepID=A0A845LCH1_HELGE|nr:flagellar hook-associated protein FlgL [Heliomicrobium gestii]MBM7866666.1 flagellar hook-associated protein 3 FlgL [Heliomicrobium gestii]MZP43054.1 flagellar hook-associated protein FlgL [Heliomicrobium gestii]
MRITQAMMTNGFMRSLNSILGDMDKSEYQLTSGKKNRLPQDDPVGSVQTMTYRSAVLQTNKYLDNATEAGTWLDNTDTALNEVTSVIHRVRTLMEEANTDTATAESRQAIAEEVDQLVDHVSQIANTTVGGRYIFGGTNTGNPPAVVGGTGFYTWNGNDGEIAVEIDAKATVAINSIGKRIFADSSTGANDGLLNFLKSVSNTLKTGAQANNLGQLDKLADKVLEQQASVGARENRIEFTNNRLQNFKLTMTNTLAQVEDADMAQVITDFKTQESVYRSALSTGARVLQPSLVDFLR